MSLRILLVVTHLLGAGHLTRAAALARAFADAGHEAILVSGGMPAPLVDTRDVRLVQLPPVRTAGTDFTALLDEHGEPVEAERLERRRDLLSATLEEARPDAVLTELFPFGRRALAGEFLTLLAHAHALQPRPLVAASVRDILVAPLKPGRVSETHERLCSLYDAVLVHGDPDFAALDASWPVDPSIRPLIRYTGYVDEGPAVVGADAENRGGVLVSGGSSAASLPLYRAALGAAEILPERSWRILVGPGLDGDAIERLRAGASSNVAVARARPDFRALLSTAAVSVSQAGYNTVVDVLRARVPAVFVPFEGGHETEQRLRAERLAARGWGRVLPEAELSPERLASLVRIAVSGPSPPTSPPRLYGAGRTVAIVEEMARKRAAPARPLVAPGRPDWSALDAALGRAGDRGRQVPLWWRDDDATSHTKALDRLLALARRARLPVALAVIPARLEASLAERLADEPLASALVHGLSHANHATQGEKKAEFGSHRLPEALAAEAGLGLRQAEAALAARLLPVFVPPWNRIAPALVPALPGLGYEGLSAFGPRTEREPIPGLVTANAHVDPIDWHGTRSLLDPSFLVAALAQAIDRASFGRGKPEPVGILTHHLVHDEAVWRFCEDLLDRLSRSPHIRYPLVKEIFSRPASSSVIQL